MDKQVISIEEMQGKLEELGARTVWKRIEQIGNWQERIALRSLFFQVGGSLDE